MKRIKKILNTREGKLAFFGLMAVTVLVVRLFVVTVVQSEKWTKIANNISIKSINTSSPRGSIYDRHGKLLAGSRQVFTVKMRSGDLNNKQINRSAARLVSIFERNGDKYEKNLPIKIINGRFYFTFDEDEKKWLRSHDLNPRLSAEKAFDSLRAKLDIPKGDRFEVQKIMQTKHNIFPPISVKNMKYNSETAKKEFLEMNQIVKDATKEKVTPRQAFKKLREKAEIDKRTSDAQAIKILNIRNELNQLGYRKYLPATIASEISARTIVYIEENSKAIKGIEIVPETRRYYPEKKLASHIIGYMGKITNEELQKFEDRNYSPSALIGKEGIERAFEGILKGKDASKTVSVDNRGNYIKTLTTTVPKKGKDVYLTIDAELQKVAEKSLKKNINAIRGGGAFSSEFGSIGASKIAPKAKTGALVALDVESGDILASASYPNYDPNIFADGIEMEDWEKLQSKNPRNSLAPAPLFNLVTKSAVQPGSTFKPATAIAALDSGLSPSRVLYDNGVIRMGNRTFACVVWNLNKARHGYLNLYRAIEVSCNYYFFDIATNQDWASGNRSLGLDSDMGVDKITQVAKNLGLGVKSGVEIPEAVLPVPSKQRKIKGLQVNLENELYANAERFFNNEVNSNSKRLQKDIETISGWIKIKNITREDMYEKYLPKVGVRKSQYERVTNLCLYTYFNQAEWSVGDAFNISIGQGENSYTPLQMARYIATIGNKGTNNKVTLIKNVEDQSKEKKAQPKKLKYKDSAYDAVLKGMRRVAVGSGSSIGKHYAKFPWKVYAKTGTAQKSGKINPKSEVSYIKSHLSAFGGMSWKSVRHEMRRLMKKYPKIYTTEDTAVRRAVINLSGNKLTSKRLDAFKPSYDEFAWVVALAPANNPKIAVVGMIPQGRTAANASPMVREVIGQYMKTIDSDYVDKKDRKKKTRKQREKEAEKAKLERPFEHFSTEPEFY